MSKPENLQKGIKLDADKAKLGEMFQDFSIPLEFTARVWEFGARKYGKSNWKYVENARNRYTNALLRHLAKETENEFDEETKLLHAAHIAWNALARLYFIALNTDPELYADFLHRISDEPAPGAPADEADVTAALEAEDREYKQLHLDFAGHSAEFNFDT